LAGTYTTFLRTADGTAYSYSKDFTLVADTWKKITCTIPGNSNLAVNNDTGSGLELYVVAHYGTDYTTSGHTDDAWIAYSNTDIAGDYAQSWTNSSSATFFLTGVQLEVGSTATPFEHEDIGTTLRKCQRYFELLGHATSAGDAVTYSLASLPLNGYATNQWLDVPFMVEKRAAPTSIDSFNGYTVPSPTATGIGVNGFTLWKASQMLFSKSSGGSQGEAVGSVSAEL
jgi:hypothetical protein